MLAYTFDSEISNEHFVAFGRLLFPDIRTNRTSLSIQMHLCSVLIRNRLSLGPTCCGQLGYQGRILRRADADVIGRSQQTICSSMQRSPTIEILTIPIPHDSIFGAPRAVIDGCVARSRYLVCGDGMRKWVRTISEWSMTKIFTAYDAI